MFFLVTAGVSQPHTASFRASEFFQTRTGFGVRRTVVKSHDFIRMEGRKTRNSKLLRSPAEGARAMKQCDYEARKGRFIVE